MAAARTGFVVRFFMVNASPRILLATLPRQRPATATLDPLIETPPEPLQTDTHHDASSREIEGTGYA